MTENVTDNRSHLMTPSELLADAFDRIREEVHGVVADLSPGALTTRPAPSANTIAWLLWHLTRVQDDHVAELAGTEQCWTAEGWCERFDLPFDRKETGYDQDSETAANVRVDSADKLVGYHDAVHARTLAFLQTTSDADLEAIVDDRWDPPVTLGARLISVIADDLQHVGQAAYARGILHRM